jgi:hypothetical protein
MPVVLSFDPEPVACQGGVNRNGEVVITIPIGPHAHGSHQQPNWEELLGKR